MIYEDQLSAIKADSVKSGTTGGIDLALLGGWLTSRARARHYYRTSRIVIFPQQKRKFIIADTPGHEQYTRNMATGASTCDLAVILIDARPRRSDPDPRRHSFITSLLGIKHIVVAIQQDGSRGTLAKRSLSA